MQKSKNNQIETVKTEEVKKQQGKRIKTYAEKLKRN